MRHTIEIESAGKGMYTVWYEGVELVKNSRSPELDACRQLLELGHTGTLITKHRGSNVISFVLDIRKSVESEQIRGC